MASGIYIISALLLYNLANGIDGVRYDPNWPSIDSRPLPKWYDEAKVGIFLNWGIYSVPSFNNEWFWYRWYSNRVPSIVEFMKKNYRPDFTYQDFAKMLTAEFYNPKEWVDIFKASGARYIVHSTKHHEGYTMYPSKYSWNWNSVDVGSGRDIIGELEQAVRQNSDIHFGIYHSLFEWYNPEYLADKSNKWQTRTFAKDKTMPELYEIVNKYKPDIVWSDGQWEAPEYYWNSTGFLSWLYNESPVKDTVVTNDRWCDVCMCHHGGFLTCHDRYNPGVLQKRKWENAMTLDRSSWGFRREATLADYLTIRELLVLLARTVSCGGNILINVGPTYDGRITPIYEEILRQLGSWLKVNGEAIYASKPWTYQNDTVNRDVWYTSKTNGSSTNVYAILLKWPNSNQIDLGSPNATQLAGVSLLGSDVILQASPGVERGIKIQVPNIPVTKMPCDWAWVFKLTYST